MPNDHSIRVESGKRGAAIRWAKEPPFEERVWRNIARKTPEECWEWTRTVAKNGYGRLKRHGRCLLAHRVVFQIVNGQIKDGLWVLHKCDNRKCCNPNHLYQGTPTQNNKDAIDRGRMPKTRRPKSFTGYRHHLTASDVALIRDLHQGNRITQTMLSAAFGIGRNVVYRIIHKKDRFAS